MEVYVLLGGVEYEGWDLLGVYHTQEDAEEAQSVFESNVSESGLYDDYDIQRRVIGARASMVA